MRFYNSLFPERLLAGTPLEKEWYDRVRASHIRGVRIYTFIGSWLWLAHIVIFDIPQKMEPFELWVKFRVTMFAFGMLGFALTYWKRLITSRFYYLPLLIGGIATSTGEAYAMRWTNLIHIFVPIMLVGLNGMLLKVNAFWSMVFAAVSVALMWPTFQIVHANSMGMAYSAGILAVAFMYFARARLVDDIEAFLNMHRLAEAQEKILKKELELTGAVQTLLMPASEAVESDRFTLHGRNISATQCGGDWWWYHQHEDKVRVLLGDVTGHGAGPAMVTATVSSFTKVLYKPDRPFVELLTNLKQHYFDYFVNSKYWMTLTACEIDLSTGKVSVWFAGSPPVFCLGRDGSMTILTEPATPLGSEKDGYGYAEHTLSEGGKIILTTDGMIEARRKDSPNPIGLRRIQTAFKKHGDKPCSEFVKSLFEYVENERGEHPQDDDYTFIAVDIAPPATKKLSA